MSATERPRLLLLHSSASSGRQWSALAAALQPQFAVHAVDLHGHGTQPPWSGDAPQTLADDTALAAAHLGERGAWVVGHSYGAAVALKLATQRPRQVHGLLAYEPVLFHWLANADADADADPPDPAAGQVAAIVATIRAALAQRAPHAAAQHFIDFWSGAGAWAALPEGARGAIAARMPTVLAHFDALLGEPLGPAQLRGLAMPMTFLTGAETVPATRRIGALLRAALPAARHLTLAGMGHMGPVSHAAEVNRHVRAFLHAHVQEQRDAATT